MSIVNIKFNSDMELVSCAFQNMSYLAHDIVSLSEFDSIIYYNAVKSKISCTDIYTKVKNHRSRTFR